MGCCMSFKWMPSLKLNLILSAFCFHFQRLRVKTYGLNVFFLSSAFLNPDTSFSCLYNSFAKFLSYITFIFSWKGSVNVLVLNIFYSRNAKRSYPSAKQLVNMSFDMWLLNFLIPTQNKTFLPRTSQYLNAINTSDFQGVFYSLLKK